MIYVKVPCVMQRIIKAIKEAAEKKALANIKEKLCV
jgi:hypothetical protein